MNLRVSNSIYIKYVLTLVVFGIVGSFFLNSFSYANHMCGTCPGPSNCGPTGNSCCVNHGCTCNCDNNQCGTGNGWDQECPGAYCCGGGGPVMATVSGYIRNSSTSAGIPNVNVAIYDSGENATKYDTTDSNGFFVFTDEVEENDTYNVSLPGNTAPQSAPAGYVPPGATTNNTSSWNTTTGAHTPLGSLTYSSQQAGAPNDCGSSCNFGYQALGTPTILSRSDICVTPGNTLPYRTGTFSWTNVPGAVRYILRVVHVNNNNASNWFNYIVAPPNQSVTSSCNATTCTATLGVQPNIKSFRIGDYLAWSVQAEAANGSLSPQVPGGAFSVNTCNPFTLSGTLNYVTVNPSTGICTPVAGQTGLHTVGNLSVDPVRATYSVSAYTYTRNANVNANNSNYTISNLPGSAGNVALNRTLVRSNDPDLAAAGIRYRYQCIKAGPTANYIYSPSLASIPVGSFSSNLSGYNFGFVLENPYEDGWFASLDGDTYGDVIAANVSGVVAPNSGVEPFLTFHGNNRSVAVFGDDIQVALDRLVEGGKYISGFTGEFWPDKFSFTPPTSATQITTVQGFNSMQTGQVYRTSVDLVNSFLTGNTQYTLGGGTGVAVLYITGTSGTLTFPQNLTTPQADRRILIISQLPVYIDPAVGTTVATIGNLATSPAHLQLGLIAQRNITFGSNYDPAFPDQPDNIVLLEGPFVAGSSDSATVSIALQRNLGLSNALYPAALVKYNPLYGNELTENSGVMEQDVIWQVSP